MAFLEIQYQHRCYLEIKKKLKVLFNLVNLTQKGKPWGSRNLLISGTILKEKNNQLCKRTSNWRILYFKCMVWKMEGYIQCFFRAIAGEQRAVTPKITSSCWEMHRDARSSGQV